jgi:hypothetical protein
MRLAALYVIATVIATGALIYEAYDTASSLNDRELSGRAEDLARAVSRDGAGQTRLFAVAGDYDVRPPVRFQFRFHLLSAHWTVARNEYGA